MMFFLGCCGVLQAIFLPGALLCLTVFRLRSPGIFAAAVFGLSLVSNYFLVWLLLLCSLYTQKVLLAVFIFEMILFIGVIRKKTRCCTGMHSTQKEYENECMSESFMMRRICKFAIFFIFICSLFLMLRKLGGIFIAWDAVASYNRWALSLASNKLPELTWHYPQMVPILYSLPYVFMSNHDIQFFSYAIFLFFLPLSILSCSSLQVYREFLFPAIVLAAGVLIWVLLSRAADIGQADFPVLFFALLSLVTLLFWRSSGEGYESGYLLLSLLFAAGGAVTKQAGIFWMLLLPFAVWENGTIPITRRELLRLGGMVFLLTAFVFMWYGYVEVRIYQGIESSEIRYVTEGIHEGRSFFERWLRAVEHWPGVWLLWLLALAGFAVRGMRVITLMGIAFTLCWSIFFSYSLRNLSVGIPFLFWSCGVGLQNIYGNRWVRRKINDIYNYCILNLRQKRKNGVVFLVVVPLVFLFVTCCVYSKPINEYLLKKQDEKLINIGNREINTLILDAMRERKLPLITDYQLAQALPGIRYKNCIVNQGLPSEVIKEYKKPYYVLYAYSPQREKMEELRQDISVHLVGTADDVSLYLIE